MEVGDAASPALKAAIKAERETFRLKRELQRLVGQQRSSARYGYQDRRCLRGEASVCGVDQIAVFSRSAAAATSSISPTLA